MIDDDMEQWLIDCCESEEFDLEQAIKCKEDPAMMGRLWYDFIDSYSHSDRCYFMELALDRLILRLNEKIR